MKSRADLTRPLQLAVRRQQGRMLAPAMLSELHDVRGDGFRDLHVLSLEDTDRLFDLFSANFQKCLQGDASKFHLRTARNEAEAIFSRLTQLGVGLQGTLITLFGRSFQFTGAVTIPADRFFPAAESLLRLEVDDLRVASSDGTQGFLLDNLDRENQLEFWCWGTQWSELAKYDPTKGA